MVLPVNSLTSSTVLCITSFECMMRGIFHQLKTLLHDDLRPFAICHILGNNGYATRGWIGVDLKEPLFSI